MPNRTIIVTEQDMQRLRDLVRRSREDGSAAEETLQKLEGELDRAEVVKPQAVPPDVITMNSTALVRVEGSKRATPWTLVYPQDADMDEDRISILEPLGTALLGFRAGDKFEWDLPAGRRQYTVEKVMHQPEAAGEFDR